MAVYHVVQRLDSGDLVVAEIRDGVVAGTKAKMVRAVLFAKLATFSIRLGDLK
jgi:hypothetical protein